MSRSVKAPDHIWAARSQDSSTLKQHADQAHDDLRTLLTLRAAELQPGGCLVATFVGSVEEDSLVSTDPQWRLFEIVNACWMELEQIGEISATERSSLALGVCLRNVQSVEGVLDELNHLYTVHHILLTSYRQLVTQRTPQLLVYWYKRFSHFRLSLGHSCARCWIGSLCKNRTELWTCSNQRFALLALRKAASSTLL